MNDKQRKRLMIASILGVISIGITSLSFSYAWYASSQRVEISGVDISIRSTRNLTISSSLNGEYKSEMRYLNQNDYGYFDPCSSMYRSKWIEEKKENPEFYRYDMPFVDNTGEPRYSLASRGLFNQEVYIDADDDVYVTLDKEMLHINEIEEANEKRADEVAYLYPEFNHEEIVERLNSLKKCLRIAILDPDPDNYHFYVIDPYKEGKTYFGGRQDIEKTDYYSYYVKDENLYETVYGEVNDRSKIIYDEPNAEDTELIGEATSFNAKTKAGVHPFNLEKSKANGFEIKEEESLLIDEIEEQIVIPVYDLTPKRLVVSIYMEGWDTDCTNAHMGASFDVSLGFKIIREM